jgi:integrase
MIASAAADGSHRGEQPRNLSNEEVTWRAREDAQDGELFRLAAYTGLRLGELIALRWEDVDVDTRRMVVHRAVPAGVEGPTKSWQARFLPLTDPAAEALDHLQARGDYTSRDDYVFCSRLGRRLDPQPCVAASRQPATRPGCARCASTHCAVLQAASSRGTPTRASSRSSLGIRALQQRSATCMQRCGPRI